MAKTEKLLAGETERCDFCNQLYDRPYRDLILVSQLGYLQKMCEECCKEHNIEFYK